MAAITKTAAMETSQAIWEYDPADPNNRVLGGSVDVIAALRTLGVKVSLPLFLQTWVMNHFQIQASDQRIQFFHSIQRDLAIVSPLSIILHNNTRWGTAHVMAERGHKLRQAINRFILNADDRFGPITVIRVNGKITKKIRWGAFQLTEEEWARVLDCKIILEDIKNIQQLFSSQKEATMYRIIPAIEELLTLWEDKLQDPAFEAYHDAIRDGIAKLQKYYVKFDRKPAYMIGLCAYFSQYSSVSLPLILVIHPYFKLDWIDEHWGGAKEQQEEILKGNVHAKNWLKEAERIVETAVSLPFFVYLVLIKNTDGEVLGGSPRVSSSQGSQTGS